MVQFDVRPSDNAQLVSLVKETLVSDREADLLIGTRAWLLLVCRIARTARSPEGEPGLRAPG